VRAGAGQAASAASTGAAGCGLTRAEHTGKINLTRASHSRNHRCRTSSCARDREPAAPGAWTRLRRERVNQLRWRSWTSCAGDREPAALGAGERLQRASKPSPKAVHDARRRRLTTTRAEGTCTLPRRRRFTAPAAGGPPSRTRARPARAAGAASTFTSACHGGPPPPQQLLQSGRSAAAQFQGMAEAAAASGAVPAASGSVRSIWAFWSLPERSTLTACQRV
jgi:hypothetical protein